ncbi:MAG TPA: EVE domain-containing protein [Polyangiaceae bacterium]|nr:EVE domain-containing protein [Polyangiaceae bacterium]
MPRRYWLVKSEPFKYSFEQLVREGRTIWDGVRNYEARNNLRAMAPGDLLLFYHSNEGLAVVGLARVARAAYPDPSAPAEDWSVVDVEPLVSLPEPVPLTSIREAPALASMAILRRSRLSVTPVTPAEFAEVLRLGKVDPSAIERAAAGADAATPGDAKRPGPAKAAPAPEASAAKVPAKAALAAKAPAKAARKAPANAALAAKAPAKAASAARAPSGKATPAAKGARAGEATPAAKASRVASATNASPAEAARAGRAPAAKASASRRSAAR